jgi:hypothetical protein
MRTTRMWPWLRRGALLILISVIPGGSVFARTADQGPPDLSTTLTPGATAWITEFAGAEQKLRIVGVADGIVTAAEGGDVRRVRTIDVMRVRVRHSDPVLNGALIGAGAAVASGLFLCTLTEPWENCRDDAGPMLKIGAIGAGIGIGLDALIRGRTTIYEAARGSTRLHVAPIAARRATGVQMSLAF